MTDSLTKLKTRQSLINTIANRSDLIAIVLNIDYFRETNERGGDNMGDKLLVYAAKKLCEEFDNNYEVYRIHGATFAILAKYDVNKYPYIIEKINTFLSNLQNENDKLVEMNLWLHMTAGIAYGAKPLHYAEDALRRAKNENKRLVIANKNYSCLIMGREDVKQKENVKFAINNNNIVPYFQPIMNIKTGQVEKYECLARMIHNGEAISPIHFIEVSKKMKMYHLISEAMITKSIERFANNQYDFSINLDASDLNDETTKDFLIQSITKHKVGNRLIVEVLETEKWEESIELMQFFDKLKSMGVKIALDDFGNGYNSYSNVTAMKPDIIKIDGSLIRNIDSEGYYQAVKNIVGLAKRLNIQTVGEFVSNEVIHNLCKELDIDHVQGYYISEPLPTIQNEGLLVYCGS